MTKGSNHPTLDAWGHALRTIHCTHCDNSHLTAADSIPERCPLCLRDGVVVEDTPIFPYPPEQVVPYAVSRTSLQAILERWARGIWLRPAALTGTSLLQHACCYLIPLWLVDGRVEGRWEAAVGFDYQVVSYQERYSEHQGWRSQEVKEGRVRWEPRKGTVTRSYDNIVAPALENHRQLMARLGQYDMDRRELYGDEALDDGSVLVPSRDPQGAWPAAESGFERATAEDCRRAADADHIRDFVLEAEYGELTWTLLLLPAYVTWYEEGDEVWPVLINGQNGHVDGIRRVSTRKATALSLAVGALAAVLFLLGGALALLAAVFPPSAGLGIPLLVLGLLLALLAPAPAIWAWANNRRAERDRDSDSFPARRV